jgi:hypothetical protein
VLCSHLIRQQLKRDSHETLQRKAVHLTEGIQFGIWVFFPFGIWVFQFGIWVFDVSFKRDGRAAACGS